MLATHTQYSYTKTIMASKQSCKCLSLYEENELSKV
jgi:hypothetical protein